MSGLIDLDSAINEISRFVGYLDDDMILRLQIAIKRLPTIDAVPVRHGHWEYIGGYWYQYRCSNCILCVEYKTNFCPHCGAKMDEVTE